MPQTNVENKAEFVERYVRGENSKLLALEAGVCLETLQGWVHRSGKSRHRIIKKRQNAAAVALDWSRLLEDAGCPVRRRTHRRKIAWVRQALMLALHRDGHSLPNIAAGLGGYDHTTVLHGVREAERCRLRRRLAAIIPTATADELSAEIDAWELSKLRGGAS